MPTVEINPVQTAPVETPSGAIIRNAAKSVDVFDDLGRKLTIRRITPSARQRLRSMAGADLSGNVHWLSEAIITFAVSHIDGELVVANSMRELEFLADRLDDLGIAAAAKAYYENFTDQTALSVVDKAKN